MLRALLAAGLMALPAAAQTVPPTTPADCAAGAELLRMLVPVEGAALTDGWCRLEGLEIGWAGSMVGYRIDTLAWQAPGLAQAMADGPPPEWMALRLDGITRRFRTGNALIDYQFDVQARVPGSAMDAELALRLAPALGMLVIERARLALPAGNLVELQLDLAATPWNPAMPLTDALEAQGAVRLERVELALEMRGLFEYYVLPSLLEQVDDPDDPAGSIAALKADLTAALAAATRISPETREAAGRLLADLPNPHGRLTLRLRSDRSLDAAAISGLDLTQPRIALAQILALFGGAEASLTYTP